ncbi:MAG: fasciclin domain-containing protein [Acidimicrobiales bacterium]
MTRSGWTRRRAIGATALCVALTVGATGGLTACSDDTAKRPRSVTTTTSNKLRDVSGQFTIARQLELDLAYSTFFRLAKESGLLDRLRSKSSTTTVFIPTALAFAKMAPGRLATLEADPKGALKTFVEGYLVDRPVSMVEFVSGATTSVTTLAGTQLAVEVKPGTGVIVGGATLVKHDISASNGVIHMVDALFEPTG